MSSKSSPYSTFGLSCPSGGNFYICQGDATEFIGCCTTNPCAGGSGECPIANLRTATFSADTYDDLPRQDCDDPRSFGIWYTCKFNQPPFVGCCNTNPCAEGSCPKQDLVPAKLSGDTGLRQAFLTPSITGSAPSATATAEPEVQAINNNGLSAGAIGGIVAGAAVVLVIVVGALMYRCGIKSRWRRERKADWPLMSSYDGETGDMAAMSSPFSGSCSSGLTWGRKRSPHLKDGDSRLGKTERSFTSTEDLALNRSRFLEQTTLLDMQSRGAPAELAGPIISELEAPLHNTRGPEAGLPTPEVGGARSSVSAREPSPVPPVYVSPEHPGRLKSPQRFERPIAPMMRDERSRSASRGRIRRVERVENLRPSSQGP